MRTVRLLAFVLTIPVLGFLISLTIQYWDGLSTFGRVTSILIMCSVFVLGFLAAGLFDMTKVLDENQAKHEMEAELERSHG